MYFQLKKGRGQKNYREDILSTAFQVNADLDQEGQARLRPTTRLIVGSPCFTVKCFHTGTRELFACGTECGKLLVGDLTDGYEQ